MDSEAKLGTYALVTAAYNEESYIERTLQAVVAQTIRPTKWIIVDDGSTDRTGEIIQRYADQYRFIEPSRIMEGHPRNLTAQVHAINKGFSLLRSTGHDFIGNLDADISFEASYFEKLLKKFEENVQLGLAGGLICEMRHGKFQERKCNNPMSVAHAVQMFRRECLEALGGYRLFTWAGADWYAEVSLRMKGWHVQTLSELKALHHRPNGQGFGRVRYLYRGGIMDYYMGCHPVFEVFRTIRRFQSEPYVAGALAGLLGFAWAFCSRQAREVPEDFMRFLRKEQMERLLFWQKRSCPINVNRISSTCAGPMRWLRTASPPTPDEAKHKSLGDTPNLVSEDAKF
jgi:glycosyltransferase involved in cell wall biosynthesis